MNTYKIGRKVSLRTAPENLGVVVDHEPDCDGVLEQFPYLVEWDDHTTSWHKWFELDAIPLSASGKKAAEKHGSPEW